MRQSYRLIYNALTGYGTAFVQGLVGFLLLPFLIHRFGEAPYGLVLLCISALNITEMFGMSISKAVTKHVSEQRARGDAGLINEIFNTALLCFSAVGLMAAGVCAVLGTFFADVFHDVPQQILSEARMSMYIVAVAAWVCLSLDVFRGILWAEQRYDLVNINAIIRSVLNATLAVLYVIFVGPSLTAVVTIMAVMRISMRFGFAYQCFKLLPKLRVSIKNISKRAALMIVGFASMVALITIANMVGYELVKFVIGFELGLENITRYGIVVFLVMFSFTLMQKISLVMVPVASKYQGLEDMDTVRYLFLTGSKYVSIIAVAVLIVIIPLFRPLLSLWVGSKYAGLVSMIIIMGVSQIFVGGSSCSQQTLSGLGKVGLVAVVSLIWAFGGTAVGWAYLAFFPEAGLLGFVIIITLARGIGSLVIIAYGVKTIAVNSAEFIYSVYLKPIVFGMLGMLITLGLTTVVTIESWAGLIAAGLCVEIPYIAAVYLFCLDRLEQKRFIGFCSSCISKIKYGCYSAKRNLFFW